MVSTQLPGIHNEDILLSIFTFLPIQDLAQCAAVCKQWHVVVTGSSHPWKGKTYSRIIFSRISAEMRAVLIALPLLNEVEVKVYPECCSKCNFYFSYPRLFLNVGISYDLRAMRDWQKVRCTYLSLHLNIAEFFFSSHSPIDFSVLQKLNITRPNWVCAPMNLGGRAESAICCALQLCPNLRELSICIDSLSADFLDALDGICHLRTLRIKCNHLEKLVFLRHCSELLEELELESCFNVPSVAYAELRFLRNLRRLRLHSFQVEEGDLEIAMPGMKSLVSLQLSHCIISDLSCLRHCGQLREVSIVVDHLIKRSTLPTGFGHLPASVRSLSLPVSAANADELSEALPCLPSLNQLSLSCEQLDRLDFLRGCPQLRRLCLDYSSCPDESQLLNLRHLSQLETLELPGFSDDLSFLSTVIPSLPQLETLTVRYRRNFDYEGILQGFPRLCSLSLFDNDGNLRDRSKLGELDLIIHGCKYVCKFFCKVV